MTEVQAAIGRLQLQKLDGWLNQRKRNAELLQKGLSDISCVRLATPEKYIGHANYKYYFFIKPELLKDGWTRDRIMEEISANGVPCFSGGCPEIYREEAFLNSNYGYTRDFRLENAKQLGETSLMLLVHPTLTEQNIQHNIEIIRGILKQASSR
jgi:dTDP-4-amino-4,6-dideoxygalactose transaminase